MATSINKNTVENYSNDIPMMKEFKNITLDEMNHPAKFISDIIKKWDSPGVVLLRGEMGSGKTTLIRMVLKLLGVEENVNSPTFSIMNEYHSSHISPSSKSKITRFFHFDFYRLNDSEELIELGFDEIWGREGHSFIEWYDKIPVVFPDPMIKVHWLEPQTLESRSIRVEL